MEHIHITPRKFKSEYLLKKGHCCVIWPSIVLFGGLPDTQKTTILKNLLSRYMRKAGDPILKFNLSPSLEPGIEVHEVIAVGNKHQDLFWFEVTTVNCHNYCIASALLHDTALMSKVIHLTSYPSLGLFKNVILDRHFQHVYDELKKQKFLQPTEGTPHHINVWKKFLPGGLLVMNFWDLGVNKAILHALSALSGYFCNCYPCLFMDLERDGEKLFEPPSLKVNRFASHADKDVVYKWRSRIQYLLRPILFAKPNPQLTKKPTGHMNMDESCIVVAVHDGVPSVEDKILKLQKVLELVAEQMGISELLNFDILAFDLKRSDESYRALKSRLESRITREHIDFPTSWLFLRSAFYSEEDIYIEKRKYQEMACECHLDEDEFESFLATFTASGSLIYASHTESLSEYVVLKPLQFFRTISRIFYPQTVTEVTSYGIVSKATAKETFGDDTPFYTTALTSLHLAVEVDETKIDLLSAGLHVTTPLYYIPALRCIPPVTGCTLDALHILFSLDIAPKSTQVTFLHSAFEVFQDSIKLIPRQEVNVLQFEVCGTDFDVPCRFEHVYHGDATEIRLHTGSNNSVVCQRVCNDIITTCHTTVVKHCKRYGHIKYGFAVMCSQDQDPSQPCNVKNVRHYLPELGTCNACQKNGITRYLLDHWVQAVREVYIVNY